MTQKIAELDSKEAYSEIIIEAQKKQITTLNKKINELKAENDDLKAKLNQAKMSPSANKTVENKASKFSEEELVCKQEISKLLEISNDRELTLEETKKLDIYTKIIQSKKHVEEKKNEMENLSNAELLQFLNPQGMSNVGTKN